jgi:hypothetical protein
MYFPKNNSYDFWFDVNISGVYWHLSLYTYFVNNCVIALELPQREFMRILYSNLILPLWNTKIYKSL